MFYSLFKMNNRKLIDEIKMSVTEVFLPVVALGACYAAFCYMTSVNFVYLVKEKQMSLFVCLFIKYGRTKKASVAR